MATQAEQDALNASNAIWGVAQWKGDPADTPVPEAIGPYDPGWFYEYPGDGSGQIHVHRTDAYGNKLPDDQVTWTDAAGVEHQGLPPTGSWNTTTQPNWGGAGTVGGGGSSGGSSSSKDDDKGSNNSGAGSTNNQNTNAAQGVTQSQIETMYAAATGWAASMLDAINGIKNGQAAPGGGGSAAGVIAANPASSGGGLGAALKDMPRWVWLAGGGLLLVLLLRRG